MLFSFITKMKGLLLLFSVILFIAGAFLLFWAFHEKHGGKAGQMSDTEYWGLIGGGIAAIVVGLILLIFAFKKPKVAGV